MVQPGSTEEPMSRRIEVGWPWVVAATVAWPLLHVLIFTLRFGEIPADQAMAQLPLFAPTGLIAALTLRYLLERASPGLPSWTIIIGVLGALPFAFAGNVMGGLLGPVGVTAFGVLPILVGAGVGWVLGKGRGETGGEQSGDAGV